ncbi:MAG: copper resistance protein CopC [Thermoactinospora sp.]|nr:copper resistance protein CopC [Thermoactinospora sp.]
MKRSPLAALTALLAALLALGVATPALAHDTLKGSDPKKDSTVEKVEQVKLEFNARVRMPYVIVRDAGGKAFQDGKPELDGRWVTQALTETLPDGAYTIAYRVVSSDGHPIEGEVPFTVKGAPKAETSESATPEASVSAAATPVGTPTQAQVAATEQAGAEQGSEGGGFPVWLIIVVGGLVGIGIGFLISARKAKP